MASSVSHAPITGSEHPAISRKASDPVLVILLAIAVVGAVLQITVGGTVRVTGSGLGCPDWPLCHGSVVPVFKDYHVALEWSHRATGTIVGLTVIAAVLRAWLPVSKWGSPLGDHHAGRLALGALGLIIVVGGLGGAVVLSELDPALRTVHLALAEIVVLLLTWAWAAAAFTSYQVAAGTGRPEGGSTLNSRSQQRLGRLAAFAAALALIALLSGSYAVWKGAGGVCPSWPLCGGPAMPESQLTLVHMTHRALAGVAAVLAIWGAVSTFRASRAISHLRIASVVAGASVVAQALIGAANPWTGFDQWAQALHLTMATVLWASLLAMAFLISRPVQRSAVDWQGHRP